MTGVELRPVLIPIAPRVEPFCLWPVAPFSPGWLRIHGGMNLAEVGSAVQSLVFYNSRTEPLFAAEREEALWTLLGEPELYGPGGLAASGPGGIAEPGCCCDLFEWRDWVRVAAGHDIDLGHEVAPLLEHRGESIRIWVDAPDDFEPDPDHPHIDFPRADLPDMLLAVQRDLVDFLGLLRTWTADICPQLTDEVVTAVDVGLAISAPLDQCH